MEQSTLISNNTNVIELILFGNHDCPYTKAESLETQVSLSMAAKLWVVSFPIYNS